MHRSLLPGDLRLSLTSARETVSMVTPVSIAQPKQPIPNENTNADTLNVAARRRRRRAALDKEQKKKTTVTIAQLTNERNQLAAAATHTNIDTRHVSPGAPFYPVPPRNQAITVAAIAQTTAAIADSRGLDSLATAARNISRAAEAYHPLADASLLADQCAQLRALLYPTGGFDPAYPHLATPRAPAYAPPNSGNYTDSLLAVAARAGGPLPRSCYDPPRQQSPPVSRPRQTAPQNPDPRWTRPTPTRDPLRNDERRAPHDHRAPHDNRPRSRSRDGNRGTPRTRAQSPPFHSHSRHATPHHASSRDQKPAPHSNQRPHQAECQDAHRRGQRPAHQATRKRPPTPATPPAYSPTQELSSASNATATVTPGGPPNPMTPDENPTAQQDHHAAQPPVEHGVAATSHPDPTTEGSAADPAITAIGFATDTTLTREQMEPARTNLMELLGGPHTPSNSQLQDAGFLPWPRNPGDPRPPYQPSATEQLIPGYISNADEVTSEVPRGDTNISPTSHEAELGHGHPLQPLEVADTTKQRHSARLRLQRNKQPAHMPPDAAPAILRPTSPHSEWTSPSPGSDTERAVWGPPGDSPPLPPAYRDDGGCPMDASPAHKDSPFSPSPPPPALTESPTAQSRTRPRTLKWPAGANATPTEAQDGLP